MNDRDGWLLLLLGCLGLSGLGFIWMGFVVPVGMAIQVVGALLLVGASVGSFVIVRTARKRETANQG